MPQQLNFFTDPDLSETEIMDVIRWADRHGDYRMDNALYQLEKTMSYFHNQLDRGYISERSYDELLWSHRREFAQEHWMDYQIWLTQQPTIR